MKIPTNKLVFSSLPPQCVAASELGGGGGGGGGEFTDTLHNWLSSNKRSTSLYGTWKLVGNMIMWCNYRGMGGVEGSH